jgi:hypothetical protein
VEVIGTVCVLGGVFTRARIRASENWRWSSVSPRFWVLGARGEARALTHAVTEFEGDCVWAGLALIHHVVWLLSSSFLPGCSTAECSPSCVPYSMATSWAGHHSRRGSASENSGRLALARWATRLGAQREYVAGGTLMQMRDRRRRCAGRREQQP